MLLKVRELNIIKIPGKKRKTKNMNKTVKIINDTEKLIKLITKGATTISDKKIKGEAEKWVANNYGDLLNIFDEKSPEKKALGYLCKSAHNERLIKNRWLKGLRVILKALKTQKITKDNSITINAREMTFNFSDLHPKIKKVSSKLFKNRHYAQAILEAYKAVVNQVKDISGVTDRDGKPLMEHVFSLNNPKIKLNNLETNSNKDEQLGFMLLYSGAALGIRNPKAHDNIVQNDSIKTFEYLAFASLLLRRLDERIK